MRAWMPASRRGVPPREATFEAQVRLASLCRHRLPTGRTREPIPLSETDDHPLAAKELGRLTSRASSGSSPTIDHIAGLGLGLARAGAYAVARGTRGAHVISRRCSRGTGCAGNRQRDRGTSARPGSHSRRSGCLCGEWGAARLHQRLRASIKVGRGHERDVRRRLRDPDNQAISCPSQQNAVAVACVVHPGI